MHTGHAPSLVIGFMFWTFWVTDCCLIVFTRLRISYRQSYTGIVLDGISFQNPNTDWQPNKTGVQGRRGRYGIFRGGVLVGESAPISVRKVHLPRSVHGNSLVVVRLLGNQNSLLRQVAMRTLRRSDESFMLRLTGISNNMTIQNVSRQANTETCSDLEIGRSFAS